MITRTLFFAAAVAMASPVVHAADVRGQPVDQQPGGSRAGTQTDQNTGTSNRSGTNQRSMPNSSSTTGNSATQSPDDMTTASGDCAPGDTSQRCRDANMQRDGGATSRPQPIAPATPADPASRNYDRR